MERATIILPDGTTATVTFAPPLSLGRLLSDAGAPIAMPCAGRGACGACRVRAQGLLSTPNDAERAALTEAQLAQGWRLACQAEALGSVTLHAADAGQARIIAEGSLPPHALAPWAGGLGIAVDIGTTTLAAYLYDLQTGSRLACRTAMNPQAPFGADVLSRMEKAEAGEAEALAGAIEGGLRALTAGLLQDTGRTADEVGGAVLTGNTAMLYLLTRTCPSPILRVPFTLSQPFGLFTDGAPYGLPHSRVYLPRCVAAYIGADITTALLAAGLYGEDGVTDGPPVLLADIGTNGELVLRAGGRLYACSTAAGPALEGVGIRCGMPAQSGAIAHARFVDGALALEVLGGPAKGLCGSGVVDVVAALLDAGVLDETGFLEEEGHALEGDILDLDGQPALRLAGDVVFTQADVRAVQLAKAAIHAGMLALLDAAGVDIASVDRLLIAGGLGSNIDPAAAAKIGLVPQALADKTVALGNAAGMGASLCLLDDAFRAASDTLPSACRIVELATNPVFMAAYVEQMMLG